MPDLAAAYAASAAEVAANDPDARIAGLFAPEDRRPHLSALHAFTLDIAAVRGRVSGPLPGEIRLQWWREALSGERAGEAAAHPFAAALLDTIAANKLPAAAFLDLIEAHVFDLYDDPMPDWATLEGYLAETVAVPLRLACLILGRGEDRGGAEAAGHAGMAIGLTRMLCQFPWHSRRGQLYLPASLLATVGVSRDDVVSGRDGEGLRAALAEVRTRVRAHLAAALDALPSVEPALRPAFLPLATVQRRLNAMERRDYHPFESLIEVSALRRIYAMWRLSRR